MNGPHLATGRYEVGNPNLDNETHRNFDLSLNYAANGFFGSFTFFSNSVDNYIYLDNYIYQSYKTRAEEEFDEEHSVVEEHDLLIAVERFWPNQS